MKQHVEWDTTSPWEKHKDKSDLEILQEVATHLEQALEATK